MSALVSKNENVRAIGNMNVNAKGDLIDSNNQVIAPASQRVARSYNRTTQNPSANKSSKAPEAPKSAVPAQSVAPAPAPTPKKKEPAVVFLEDMSDDEIEYLDELDADVPEKIETKPKKK
jgi:hypothetical protein